MKAWLLPRMLQSGRVYTHAHTYTFMREHMNIYCFGKASPTQSLEIQLALGSGSSQEPGLELNSSPTSVSLRRYQGLGNSVP